MFQVIQNRRVFVVDLTKGLPTEPITWRDTPELKPYAEALQKALDNEIVKEPGKYGIEVDADHTYYVIHAINE